MSERRFHNRCHHDSVAQVRFGESQKDCLLLNISAGGAAFASAWRPALGSQVTVDLDEIQSLPARVSRHLVDGFAVSFEFEGEQGADLASRLTVLADMRQFLA